MGPRRPHCDKRVRSWVELGAEVVLLLERSHLDMIERDHRDVALWCMTQLGYPRLTEAQGYEYVEHAVGRWLDGLEET